MISGQMHLYFAMKRDLLSSTPVFYYGLRYLTICNCILLWFMISGYFHLSLATVYNFCSSVLVCGYDP